MSDGGNQVGRRFSVEEVGFFEGAEKLLEMWFLLPGTEEASSMGLRVIPKYVQCRDWGMVKVRPCKMFYLGERGSHKYSAGGA